MKTNFFQKGLYLILCITGLIVFTACPNVVIGDPEEQPVHYLAFKNKGENIDFFDNNANYSSDSITYKNTVGHIAKFGVMHISNQTVFAWSAWSSTAIYIDYKNGDIDTLTQVSVPSLSSANIPRIEELKNLKIYFNGQLVKELDFANNPSLKQEYRDRNCPIDCGGKNPILIELSKQR